MCNEHNTAILAPPLSEIDGELALQSPETSADAPAWQPYDPARDECLDQSADLGARLTAYIEYWQWAATEWNRLGRNVKTRLPDDRDATAGGDGRTAGGPSGDPGRAGSGVSGHLRRVGMAGAWSTRGFHGGRGTPG